MLPGLRARSRIGFAARPRYRSPGQPEIYPDQVRAAVHLIYADAVLNSIALLTDYFTTERT